MLPAAVMALSAWAMGGKCGPDLHWDLSGKGVLTITGTGTMNDYSKGDAPWRYDLVNELEIAEGVTSIGNNAFAKSKLYSAKLPSTITSIGKGAFDDCHKLSTVQLPYGLVSIGDNAFRNCELLVKIVIPGSVRQIGSHAFAGCKTLATIGVPDRLESLGEDAFKDCKSLSTVTSLPEFVTTDNYKRYGLTYSSVSRYNREGRNNVVASVVDDEPVVERTHAPAHESKPAAVASKAPVYGTSDIDRNIPLKPSSNTQTFAFIFANENYDNLPPVPFAINDGKSFAAYCRSTLGLPESNVNVYYDATFGNMKAAIDYMQKVDATFKGNADFIVYYAGHGAPDQNTAKAFLVPTDAHTVSSTVCYPLDELYSELGNLQSKSVKVFVDACFSGRDRTNDVLAKGSRVPVIKPKAATVTGNVVVISATANDQPAWFYERQGHGLFTYCLLKALQENGGEMSMGELSDYLQERVPQISIVENRTIQTPTLQSSPSIGTAWRMWQLK